MMTPMGALMIEHRLIERMVHLLGARVEGMEAGSPPDPAFVDATVDFIRSYADRCHHGKEEDILFHELGARPLEEPYKRVMHELIQEHVRGRQLTAQVAQANARLREGDSSALEPLAAAARGLVDFYPRHIEKEDRHFFVPAAECFSKKELAAMLERFFEFDRLLIHERYRDLVAHWEATPVTR